MASARIEVHALALAGALFLVSSASSADDNPVAPPPAATDVVEVKGVKGNKSGQTTFTGDEARQVPGALGDPFRVMEALPGVVPMVSGLPFFFVRGAPPGNNGYYLDGVRVPLLYHVGAGPSVIHPALIDKVDFWPGGYPAQYGRFAGGILSGQTRAPADEIHGEGNVRLFDAGALLEAPFADGKGSVLIAGRYSYTAAIVSLAAPDTVLDYWDYQARVTYRLGDHDTIGLFGFGSYDFLGDKRDDGSTRTDFATQFHRLDARWDHELPHHGKMRVGVTIGSDKTGTDDIAGVRDRMLAARLFVEQPVGPNVLVRGGADMTLDHYDLDSSSSASPSDKRDTAELYPPRNDLAMGMHLDAVIGVTGRWEVTPGIRVDLFESVRAQPLSDDPHKSPNGAVPSVDPRLLSRLKMTKNVTLVSTLGLAHQPPAFFVPIPGLQLGRLDDGLQTSVQTSEGFEIALPLGITATPTFFYHRYFGLSDFATTCGITSNSASGDGGNETDSCVDKRVKGRTIGGELLVKRSLTAHLTGWVSYTLSRSTRTTTVAAFDFAGLLAGTTRNHKQVETEIPSDFDRTHVLNVIGAYDLGRNWRIGARFYYYTGRPYSQEVLGVPIPPFNGLRYPDFYRFDARVEKAWQVGKKGRIAVVFEWQNVTLQKEATSLDCKDPAPAKVGSVGPPSFTPSTCSFDYIGPVTIPSIGVEGSF